jgi:hypothetical protein
MQAFFWDSGGGRTDGIVQLLKSGVRNRIPGSNSREGRVEQEKDGSWAGSWAMHRKVWPEPGPDISNGHDQARRIPGDKFFQAAGSKPVGLCPE